MINIDVVHCNSTYMLSFPILKSFCYEKLWREQTFILKVYNYGWKRGAKFGWSISRTNKLTINKKWEAGDRCITIDFIYSNKTAYASFKNCSKKGCINLFYFICSCLILISILEINLGT